MTIGGITPQNYVTNSLSKTKKKEEPSARESFQMAKDSFEEENKLTPDKVKREDDWRYMEDAQWDKLLNHVDEYIDAFKEEMKQMEEKQQEAALESSMEAPADMKTIAAQSAALCVAANGMAPAGPTEDSFLDKSSWTYGLETDDQAILAKAKKANEFVDDMLTKSQEIALVGDTTIGISEAQNAKEVVTVDEEDGEKTWTITCFSEDGIICNQSRNGETTELWRLDYKNKDDYKKVWDFLNGFDKDADLKFSGSKEFWEDFLAGNISNEEIGKLYEQYNEK